jgi:glutathione synthase/RimK-type ligase-like ATP-grasp enzyme
MRLAIVSCEGLPTWEVDDRALMDALAAAGVAYDVVPWTADVDWSSWTSALLRTPWDYADQVGRFLAWADEAAARTRLFHPPAILRWNLRKTYLRDLAEAGVPIAPTVWVDAPEDVAPALEVMGWPRAFLKPVVGASARWTMRLDRTQAAEAAAFVARAGEPMILQPYLDAVEREGELSAIVIDGVVTHAVRKVPVPGDYRVQDDYGASDMPIPLTDELAQLTEQTLRAAAARLGLTEALLYARVDALRGADGRLVLNELEIVEPSLFFRHGRHAAPALVRAWRARLGS